MQSSTRGSGPVLTKRLCKDEHAVSPIIASPVTSKAARSGRLPSSGFERAAILLPQPLKLY
jgi:hypothetical protein